MSTTPLTVLYGGQYIDTKNGDIKTADIAIENGLISGVYPNGYPDLGALPPSQKIDVTGKTVTPGFINTHLHVESSLITPLEYDRMTLPRGTTTIMWDPHELANVKGTIAFDFAIASAEKTVQDVFFGLSSCVPAVSHLGTSGANISAEDMKPYMNNPHVFGLAEMMNIGGVMADDPDVIAKLDLFKDGYIGGHLPLVTDDAILAKYRAHHVRDDHECVTADEALKKIRYGFNILIREGTAAQNLEGLASILTEDNDGRVALCTDDRHPDDVSAEGELDYIIRKAISLYDPKLHGDDKDKYVIRVYQAASLWGAQNYDLHDRGAVETGMKADLVILDDVETCKIANVLKDGKLVTENLFEQRPTVALKDFGVYDTIKFTGDKDMNADDFVLSADQFDPKAVPVIGIIPNQIVTQSLTATLTVDEDNNLLADPDQNILHMSVIERHGQNGNVGHGFVKGFGLKNGAIASSVGHDDHNVIVAGSDPEQMAMAANKVKEIQGGFVLVHDGKVVAVQELPVAGLMSDKPWEDVAVKQEAFIAACKKAGFSMKDPTMTLAFLALPVIPDIKLTDRGLTRFNADGGYPVPALLI